MATFSNIPELGVAEILSGAMGKLVGSLGGKAMDTVNEMRDKLTDLCERVSAGDTSVVSEIDKIEKTLDTIEKTVDNLDKSLTTIEKTAATLEVPLTVLDIALKVAKLIPVPVPPPVPVLISLLSELIAQIKQIVSAMKAVAKTLRQILDMIRKMLKRLRQMIQALRASLALTASGGNDALVDKGVINRDGTNILSNVGIAIGTDGTSLVSVGGAEVTQSVENTGDWICTVYKESKIKPTTIASRDYQPDGWTLTEPTVTAIQDLLGSVDSSDLDEYAEVEVDLGESEESIWWSSKAVVSGETGRVNGSWSQPERYVGSGGDGGSLDLGEKKDKIEGTISTEEFLQGMYGNGAIVVIDGPEDAYNFLVDLVEVISAAGISMEGQDKFRKVFGEQEQDGNKNYYTTPNGDVLELEVVVDPKSPNIAPLYYVTATDVKTGTIVYTGTKTFATDKEVLINEATVRLDSIFL